MRLRRATRELRRIGLGKDSYSVRCGQGGRSSWVGGYHGFATHTRTHTLTVATGKCREGVVANNIVQLIWIILICCSLSATPACTGARAATACTGARATFSDIPPGTRILPTIEVPAPKTLERCQIHPSPTREAHCRSLHGT